MTRSTQLDISGRRLGRSRRAILFDDLLQKHTDETVALYGDAAAQALEEFDGDVDTLLETVDPLATVDLSTIDRPEPAGLSDGFDPEKRLEMLNADPEPLDPVMAETIETIERILDANMALLARTVDNGR